MCIACERALGEPSVLYIIMLDFHFPTCNVHVYNVIVCTRCNFTPCYEAFHSTVTQYGSTVYIGMALVWPAL